MADVRRQNRRSRWAKRLRTFLLFPSQSVTLPPNNRYFDQMRGRSSFPSPHNRNFERGMDRAATADSERGCESRWRQMVRSLALSPLLFSSVWEPRNKWPRGRGIRRAIYPVLVPRARPALARAEGMGSIQTERLLGNVADLDFNL